jgi:hypothetical protein
MCEKMCRSHISLLEALLLLFLDLGINRGSMLQLVLSNVII